MVMRNSWGGPYILWRPGLRRRDRSRVVSRKHVTYLQLVQGARWWLYEYHPWKAWYCTAVGEKGQPISEPTTSLLLNPRYDVKRRIASANGLPAVPALSCTSILFGKLPLLREFLSATAYEDGTPRMPGYVTLRNRGITYELTLYDFDSGQRLPVRAITLDEVYQALEKLLGADEAPWEIDPYLTEQLGRRRKRGKKGS